MIPERFWFIYLIIHSLHFFYNELLEDYDLYRINNFQPILLVIRLSMSSLNSIERIRKQKFYLSNIMSFEFLDR